MIVEKWKRRLPATCGFERRTNYNDSTFLLTMCYETYKILVYKQWIKYPMDDLADNNVNDPIAICSDSAEYIIKNTSPLLVKSPFLYRYLYSFYINSIICSFNTLTGNADVKAKYNNMIIVVLEFYENISSSADISKIYHSRLTHLKATLDNNSNGKLFENQAENEGTEINIVDDDFNKYLDLLFGSVGM